VTGPDPWADPDAPVQHYAGPPATVPANRPPYGWPPPSAGQPSFAGQLPYAAYGAYGGPAPWGLSPARGPRRPGQVVTSAVLAFVQAALVGLAALYLWMIASIAGIAARQAGSSEPAAIRALAAEGTVLAVVELVSAALLVAAGVVALNRRSRAGWWLLVVAHAVQVLLAGYWAVRLTVFLDDLPGPDPSGAPTGFTLLFAAAPLVGLGMVLFGPGRRWFA
jgi:hypothetical protein